MFRLCLLLVSALAVASAFNVGPMVRPQQRSSVAMSAGKIRELRDRIGSIKNTQKITSAMRLVAAAKVRRAQDAVLRSRPFSENLERVLGGLLETLKYKADDLPLLASRPVKTVAVVVISGERGLCGGYNSKIIQK